MSERRSRERVKVKWSQHSLELAFRQVENGVTIRKAARDTGIPFSTLQERLKYKNQEPPRLGRTTVFTKDEEKDMADQIKLLAKIFYGCTSIDIRKMAYEYAEKNKKPHNFNKTLEMAGRDWLNGFLKRNKLSARKAEGTSMNRATAFNKQEVTVFYNLLENLMDKHKFLARNIYNVDETGVSSVQEPGKIIAEKGQKRVGSITSGERGRNVTAVCAMSATGMYIPPMLIYPRQRHSVTLEVDGPRGAIYKCFKNGWINEDLFVDWLKHFVDNSKPTENEPILLILDNHASHISLRAYEFCKANNIVMLSLPPHGSHRIQPLDVSVYGPLKTAYKQECNLFMKANLGRQITQTDIASLFRKAFHKVATIPKAESGFLATGIYPFNPDVFSDEDFLAADVLNSSLPAVFDEEMRQRDTHTPNSQIMHRSENPSPSSSSTVVSESLLSQELLNELPVSASISAQQSGPNDNFPNNVNLDNVLASHQPGVPPNPLNLHDANRSVVPPLDEAASHQSVLPSLGEASVSLQSVISSTSKQTITAQDLIPIPKLSTAPKKQSNRKQHAIVITGTPFKTKLMEKENRKMAKLNKKKSETKTYKTVRKTKTKKMATKIAKDEKNTETKIKKEKTDITKRKVKKRVLQDIDDNTSNSEIEMEDVVDDDDTDIDDNYQNKCLICDDYGRDNEMWYRCVLCGRWAHEECSGYDSPEDYKCDLCINRA